MRYYSEATVNEMLLYLARSRYFPIVSAYPSIEIPELHGKLVNIREVRDKMIKYGFTAHDMTVTEFVEDELTAVLEASEVSK